MYLKMYTSVCVVDTSSPSAFTAEDAVALEQLLGSETVQRASGGDECESGRYWFDD